MQRPVAWNWPKQTTGLLVLQDAKPFFVPQPSKEGTTGPNWLKFYVGPPRGWTRDLTGLEIRSGVPMGSRVGAEYFENSIFFIFFLMGIGIWSSNSKSLVYVNISSSFNHFNVQGVDKWEGVDGQPLLKIHKPFKTSFLSAIFYFYV